MNNVTAAFPGRTFDVILDNLNTHKKNEPWLKATRTCNFISPDKRVLAQSGRDLVLDLAGAIT